LLGRDRQRRHRRRPPETRRWSFRCVLVDQLSHGSTGFDVLSTVDADMHDPLGSGTKTD
jgi:pimeloyl-ACP methyl ester carboxylesterase